MLPVRYRKHNPYGSGTRSILTFQFKNLTGMMPPDSTTPWFKRAFLSFLGMGVIAAFIYGIIRYRKLRSQASIKPSTPFKSSEQGLSEAEAAALHTDERILARQQADKLARRERLRKNTLSIFNLTILVMAVSQMLLKDILGAVGTLAALVVNISVNTFQETRAARQVGMLSDQAQPRATVIREGRLRNLDLDEVVAGDVLVAGRGDEILADGTLLEAENFTIDETMLEEGKVVSKQPDDVVHAGSFCSSGWAVYRANKIPVGGHAAGQQNAADSPTRSLTPLQDIVRRTLYALLVITGVFYLTFILDVLRLDILPAAELAAYREILSIIFSIAPGGLFFMIVINYAVGSADIARLGALVRSSLMVESMAQMTTFCLIQRGNVKAVTLELEMIPDSSGKFIFSENRARRILGNYAHSVLNTKFPQSILAASLEGSQQSLDEQAPYLSINGWEAANFASKAQPGSYVIGDPEILKTYLAQELPSAGDADKNDSGEDQKKGIVSRLRKRFQRDQAKDHTPGDERSLVALTDGDINATQNTGAQDETPTSPAGWLQRVKTGLAKRIPQRQKTTDQLGQQEEQKKPDEILRLMFAYSPESQPLYDREGRPHCPQNLTPVCFIRFVEQVRPEVQQLVKTFQDSGVDIKVLSDGEPLRTLAIAQQVGLVDPATGQEPVATGGAIEGLDLDDLTQMTRTKALFASLTTNQMSQVVSALRSRGEYVGVMGNSDSDLAIMRQADLKITTQGSSPKLLENSDIIFLRNSPGALSGVLQKGQQIVNGTMDVLRLNLNQITYILILLVFMFFSGERTFYYRPAQGGAIGIFSVVLPSIALTLWANKVAVNRSNMRQQLVHFVAPAAILTSVAVLVVHITFVNAISSIEEAQMAVTNLLVTIGLFLVFFIKPPSGRLSPDGKVIRDWRGTYLAGTIFIIFHLATRVSLAQRFLMIEPLSTIQEYLFVWLVSLVWVVLTIVVWRLRWLQRGLDWSTRWMAPTARAS
jgi:magnesium-transporting ATPase (P-type)